MVDTPYNILLQIYGEGFGHVTRCEPLIERLYDYGMFNVRLRSFGKNFEYLSKLGYKVEKAKPDLVMRGKSGRFDMLRSVYDTLKESTWGRAILSNIRVERDFYINNIDLVVSDSCPYPPIGAHYANKPSLLIENQTGLNKRMLEFLPRTKKWILRRGYELLEICESFANEILVPDLPDEFTLCKYTLSDKLWIKNRTRFIGPMVRSSLLRPDFELDPDVDKKYLGPENKQRVLVVVGGRERTKLLEIAKKAAKSNSKLYYNILSGAAEANDSGSNYKVWSFVHDNSCFLRDPRLATVVTQSGHSTSMELVSLGIPFITIPDEGQLEQMLNAQRSEELGISIKLGYNDLSERSLNEAIDRVTSDSMYKKNIGRMSELARSYRPAETIAKLALLYVERYDRDEQDRTKTSIGA